MKLTKETFDRVKMMLESLDREDIVLGISAMDTTDFKDNFLYVLLMAKEANIKYDNMWKDNAPTMHHMFIQLGINLDKPITFDTVLKMANAYNAPLHDIQFIMDKYANQMRDYLNYTLDLKDNPINKLTIKINDYDYKTGTVGNDLKGTNADGSILRDVPDNAEQEVE